ncbi:Topoisomerase II subunit A [Mycoplasma suis KI3806]|uniref:DNA topoisomerase (ATP-hydrolyzing) n=1 Tax=Mycoplasma suis (strain KI_3806) TaxID=708248 RepID=F0V2P7_MYCS3|nr:DNA topoisomerase (ATP-hydrolyzing) [Mycoplasma suis]CBZ40119.1 Topoisomerase II subunit A [Mycoplasma suis KI3806]
MSSVKPSSKLEKILEGLPSSNVENKDISVVCDESFLNYSLSVITSRALPDLKDGLKPVHRRILYAAYEEKLFNDSRFKKSATLVGAVMGSYHPHGDKSIYDALVRLSQDFKMRYPLLEGQGNFGSIDGDVPAAMRYTEIKLSKFGEKFLSGIKEECVDFVDNYDGSKQEPSILPVIVPSILLNGSEGIAVGMATKIPPHNLREVCDAIIALIDNPELQDEQFIEYIKGPDFPTGGEIIGIESVKRYHSKGLGKIILRSKVEIDANKHQLIIKEIPFGIKKADLIKKIADLAYEGKNAKARRTNEILQRFLQNIRDESNLKEGIRLIIECKKGSKESDLKAVLNNLYKYARLQVTFAVNLTLLVDGKPQLLGIGAIIRNYLQHQLDMLQRKTKFNLREVQRRIHLLEGRETVVRNLDEVIRIITDEDNPEVIIQEKYSLTPVQIKDIFDLPLRQLKKIEFLKLTNELDQKRAKRDEYQALLDDKNKQYENIKKELIEIKNEFKNDLRKTLITPKGIAKITKWDCIPKEDIILKVTQNNYIAAIPLDKIDLTHRNTVGENSSSEFKTGDLDVDLLLSSSHDDLFIFTNYARVFKLKAHEIKISANKKWSKKPQKLNNLIPLMGKDEKAVKIISLSREEQNNEEKWKDIDLLFATKFGFIRKISFYKFFLEKKWKSGKTAMRLSENDQLKFVIKMHKDSEILLASSKNKVIRFKSSILEAKRTRKTFGVRGINLRNDDGKIEGELISASSTYDGDQLLSLVESGKGKITSLDSIKQEIVKVKEYDEETKQEVEKIIKQDKKDEDGELEYEIKLSKKWGGKGVLAYKNKENEKLIACVLIKDSDQILLMTNKDHINRFQASQISVRKTRRTEGSQLISLKPNEKLVFFAKYQLPDDIE